MSYFEYFQYIYTIISTVMSTVVVLGTCYAFRRQIMVKCLRFQRRYLQQANFEKAFACTAILVVLGAAAYAKGARADELPEIPVATPAPAPMGNDTGNGGDTAAAAFVAIGENIVEALRLACSSTPTEKEKEVCVHFDALSKIIETTKVLVRPKVYGYDGFERNAINRDGVIMLGEPHWKRLLADDKAAQERVSIVVHENYGIIKAEQSDQYALTNRTVRLLVERGFSLEKLGVPGVFIAPKLLSMQTPKTTAKQKNTFTANYSTVDSALSGSCWGTSEEWLRSISYDIIIPTYSTLSKPWSQSLCIMALNEAEQLALAACAKEGWKKCVLGAINPKNPKEVIDSPVERDGVTKKVSRCTVSVDVYGTDSATDPVVKNQLVRPLKFEWAIADRVEQGACPKHGSLLDKKFGSLGYEKLVKHDDGAVTIVEPVVRSIRNGFGAQPYPYDKIHARPEDWVNFSLNSRHSKRQTTGMGICRAFGYRYFVALERGIKSELFDDTLSSKNVFVTGIDDRCIIQTGGGSAYTKMDFWSDEEASFVKKITCR